MNTKAKRFKEILVPILMLIALFLCVIIGGLLMQAQEKTIQITISDKWFETRSDVSGFLFVSTTYETFYYIETEDGQLFSIRHDLYNQFIIGKTYQVEIVGDVIKYIVQVVP